MISLILIIIHLTLADENVTKYKWFVTDESALEGKCFEVDTETSGDRFKKKVATVKCRPKENLLTTVWRQKNDGPGGKCFEVDGLSRGKTYSRKVTNKKCTPKDVGFKMVQGKCYRYGQRQDGATYLVGTKKNECSPSGIQPTFILGKSGDSGKCVVRDPSSGEIFKKPLDTCRPSQTLFKWIHHTSKEPHVGRCYEISKFGGRKAFIDKVDFDLCKPKENLEVIFFHPDKFKKSGCFELLQENGKVVFSKKVRSERCKKNLEM